MNLKESNLILYITTVQVLLLMICINQVSALPPDSLFAQANQLYMDQKYSEAIESYEKLISKNAIGYEVYYNLGNAYYKTGEIAPAILNFERAKLLNPSDPDVLYNLRIANLATIDKIEPVPMVFYEKWWNDFVSSGSIKKRAIFSLILLWITMLCAAGYLFFNSTGLRKLMFYMGLVFLLSGCFTLYVTSLQYSHLNDKKSAVIFSESAYVKSSPDKESANLFMLHAGTKIDVIDQLQSWKKIRIANGSEGWIESNDIELI